MDAATASVLSHFFIVAAPFVKYEVDRPETFRADHGEQACSSLAGALDADATAPAVASCILTGTPAGRYPDTYAPAGTGAS